MLFLDLIEIVVVIALGYIYVTQMLIPFIRGTVLFPYFRSSEHLLFRERARVVQMHDEEELKQELDRLKQSYPHKEDPHGSTNPNPHSSDPGPSI